MSSSNTKNPKAARDSCYYVVETPRPDSYIIARVFYAHERWNSVSRVAAIALSVRSSSTHRHKRRTRMEGLSGNAG
jgi:hypothetical protein